MMAQLRASPWVAANLLLAFALPALVLYFLGGNGADVVFSAQAPFVVVAAIAASVASNVLMPRLAMAGSGSHESVGVGALLPPFLAVVLAAICVAFVAFYVSSSLVLSERVSGHAGFLLSMVASAVSGCATAVGALLIGAESVAGQAARTERRQFGWGLLAALCTPYLAHRWGVVGGAMAFAVKPLCFAIHTAYAQKEALASARSSEERRAASDLLRAAWPLIPSHSLQKMGPLVDRTFLSHAEPSLLAAFALVTQVVGAALAYFDRTTIRSALVGLSRLPLTDRRVTQSGFWRAVGPVLGICAAFAAVWIGFRVVGASLQGGWSPTIPWGQLDLMVGYGLLAIAIGAAAQKSVVALYATSRLGQIARISTSSFLCSLVLRVVAFLSFGLVGFLCGAMAHHALSTVLFLRASRRHGLI